MQKDIIEFNNTPFLKVFFEQFKHKKIIVEPITTSNFRLINKYRTTIVDNGFSKDGTPLTKEVNTPIFDTSTYFFGSVQGNYNYYIDGIIYDRRPDGINILFNHLIHPDGTYLPPIFDYSIQANNYLFQGLKIVIL